MRVVRYQIQDVLEIFRTQRTNRIDVLVAVATMRREDLRAMRSRPAMKHTCKGSAIDRGWDRATGDFNQCRKEIDPLDHRIASSSRLDNIYPDTDKRHANSAVVKVPFREWYLRSMIAGIDEQRVARRKMLLR